MRKGLSYLFTLFASFYLLVGMVMAYSVEVSATSTSVTVGNTVSLSIKVSGAAGKFLISSSDSGIVSVASGSTWIDNGTENITLKANSEGTATIFVTADDVTTYEGDNVSVTKQVKITVNPKPVVSNGGGSNNNGNATVITPRAKSSNNFLTSLTIDGLELKEKFDKEKLEYTLDIPADTEKIKINAQLADSDAKVTGTGEVKVSPGLNVFEIVVTAENGSKRTYKISATLLELIPLTVAIDGDNYTIMRKRSDLPKLSEYDTEKLIKIGDNEIEGYHNEKLNCDIVGLKDKNGKIHFYTYNNGTYKLYNEYTFGGTTLVLSNKAVDGLKKTSFMYGNDKIESYQEVKIDLIKNTYALDDNEITGNQFYLFYAKNLETGKEYLYQYDALEKTVQRYNMEVLRMYKNHSDKYYLYLLGSLLIIGILMISLATSLMRNKKKKYK